MSVDIEKICRTCLALHGPLLSIYDGGTYGDTIANMLRDFTKMKPHLSDNMPQKVCLACISEINRCYSFKMKCENSYRTLRQLLPNAMPEENSITNTTRSVQTTPERVIVKKDIHVQTSPLVETCRKSINFPLQSQVQEDNNPVTLPTTPLTLDVGKSPNKIRKRRFTAELAENDKQSYKKKITESYNIDCEGEGYEFILKLDTNQHSEVKEKENVQTVLVNPSNCTIANAETYELASENFECTEYEIQAVVEDEDANIQSDDDNSIISVKTELTVRDDNPSKNFVIVSRIEESKCSTANQRKPSNVKKEYGCTECVMTFYSLKVLRRHMSKHHDLNIDEIDLNDIKYRLLEKKSETQKCDNETVPVDAGQLQDIASQSDSTVIKTPVLKYVCSKCSSTFSSQRALKYHKKRNICNSISYECDQCERVFSSIDKLESHKLSHKNAAITCLECGKIFMTTEELSNHQINVHKRNARNQCNICKKVFTMLSTLRDHMRTHSGEKPFLCTICGKSFTQSANLKQHIQRHDKDKKFKCDECPNSYVTKAELFSHKRSHNGDHPYKCEDCSATFTTSSSLVKHRRRHTGERPYACDICPMRFAVLNVLKNHRRLHTGEKPYKCPHCDKRFTQRGDCMIHASRHVENNMYVCTCGKGFSNIDLFHQHSKQCHPELYNKQTKLTEDENFGEVDNDVDREEESEPQRKRDEVEDMIELNLAKICGQSGNTKI